MATRSKKSSAAGKLLAEADLANETVKMMDLAKA